MRPFFPYYGSAWKRSQRGFYPAPGSFPVVWELFGGAAGYSTFHAHPRVVVCDIDEAVVTTWQYLLRVSPREVLALPDIEADQKTADLRVCPEARVLIGWWLGRARPRHATRPGQWFGQYPAGGRFWSLGVRERIARQLTLIAGWKVRHCDYQDAPVPRRALRFVDAPYEGRPGRGYRHHSGAMDYQRLGVWCRRQRGTTIVCEQQGANWLPFVSVGAVRSVNGTSREVSCVLRNGRIVNQQLALL